MTTKEKYLGSATERQFIKGFLSSLRDLEPREMCTVADPICLKKYLRNGCKILPTLFNEVVAESKTYIEEFAHIRICTLPLERMFLSEPPRESLDLGGFHSPLSVGYNHFFEASFVMLLNSYLVQGPLAKWLPVIRTR